MRSTRPRQPDRWAARSDGGLIAGVEMADLEISRLRGGRRARERAGSEERATEHRTSGTVTHKAREPPERPRGEKSESAERGRSAVHDRMPQPRDKDAGHGRVHRAPPDRP